jgi:PilZ domain
MKSAQHANASDGNATNQSEPPMMRMTGHERRQHHRHDLETRGIPVERWDTHRRKGLPFGKILDISAGGVRIVTEKVDVRPEQHVRVRLELPDYAGISPFVAPTSHGLQPRAEWIGWLTVARVISLGKDKMELAGRLVDMDEMDRGMLGLYLSTQPLAA